MENFSTIVADSKYDLQYQRSKLNNYSYDHFINLCMFDEILFQHNSKFRIKFSYKRLLDVNIR